MRRKRSGSSTPSIGVHRHVQQMRRRADVQPHVVLEGFDPIHIVEGTKSVRSPERTANRSAGAAGSRSRRASQATWRVSSSPGASRNRLVARLNASAKRSSVTGFSR